jgi:hypothetical protein
MRRITLSLSLILCILPLAKAQRWRAAPARDWYSEQAWLVGANYIPATAVNQLEMWQADTFDPQRIDLELGWAEGISMNTMRVFLDDLLWQQDAAGFKQRIDTFLKIASKHKIRTIFVLFDSCWDPSPELGKQQPPVRGVHNSRWVQSPGAKALEDSTQYPRLEAYVKGVVGAFANDKRILAWDIWNEPDNVNLGSYEKQETPNKVALVLALLPQAFEWARAAHPKQPLTSGVWRANGDWSDAGKLSAVEKVQLDSSDVVSFHNYGSPEDFQQRVEWLEAYNRPILCTEYLLRQAKSTFEAILPIAKQRKVAALNWGLVAGKTQTYLPWDSWENPYTDREPAVWQHDIFRTDGMPYREEEEGFIRTLIGRKVKR